MMPGIDRLLDAALEGALLGAATVLAIIVLAIVVAVRGRGERIERERKPPVPQDDDAVLWS